MRHEVTIDLPTTDLEVDVEYTFDPGEPDQWYDAYGDPGTPGSPPSIEIIHVWAELPSDTPSKSETHIVDIKDIISYYVEEEIKIQIIDKYHS